MKKDDTVHQFGSISDLHRVLGLQKPLHPLISLIDNSNNQIDHSRFPKAHVLKFYKISYMANLQGNFKYGQRQYDFKEGGLCFVSPNQVISDYDEDEDYTGYMLLVHPDFLLNYPLIRKIRQYGFFSYAIHESLHLSDKEKATIIAVYKNVEDELSGSIDDSSRDVIVSQIELLLNYANRFYKRQFKTRETASHDLLEQLEAFLEDYFSNDELSSGGVPSVQYLSEKLNVSPTYLSDTLRSLTGQNTQQHIHQKLIAKAKEKLSITKLSISEIAYDLGFEHTQSFSKLFKAKTNLSPLAFRQSFN